MDAIIKKWGNSPARRLNATTLKVVAFDLEQHVKIKASKGRILIEPTEPLDDLIAGVTSDNLHDTADFGEPLGRETL